jgi:prepilin peptidase CpaA
MPVELSILAAHLVLTASVGVAACIDLFRRRVPNWLTLSLALAGLASAALRPDLSIGMATAGLAVGLLIPFVLFALGMLGAGDAKLLAAIGAWMGPAGILWVMLLSGVAGGILALATAVAQGQLRPALRNTAVVGVSLLTTRRTNWISAADAAQSEDPGRRFTMPYAAAILAGLVTAQVLMYAGVI